MAVLAQRLGGWPSELDAAEYQINFRFTRTLTMAENVRTQIISTPMLTSAKGFRRPIGACTQ